MKKTFKESSQLQFHSIQYCLSYIQIIFKLGEEHYCSHISTDAAFEIALSLFFESFCDCVKLQKRIKAFKQEMGNVASFILR